MTNLSEAYGDKPLHQHLMIPLKFESNPTVPETHIWPQIKQHSNVFESNTEQESIPVIDFSSPDAANLIKHACETWGVFQLTNHGLCSSFLEDALLQADHLFTLPSERKMKALRTPGVATGYGVVRMTPFFEKLMWHEGFTIMGSCENDAKKLWPHDYQQFCDKMDLYQKKMKELCDQILFKILESLDISEDDINRAKFHKIWDNPNMATQLNSYPPCPKPDVVLGLAPHTDSFLFTILNQNTSGFQVFREGYGWVMINPIKGALVVNVGDILHMLTNARFPSVLHRAVVNEITHRFTIAYFYGPPTDFHISPLPKLVDEEQNPKYQSLTVKEFSLLKADNIDALPMLRNEACSLNKSSSATQ